MVNGILLENNAYATVIIRDCQFIGGSSNDENYTFVYGNDSTIIVLHSNSEDSDDHGSPGFFGDDFELILIVLVALVCMIIVCFIAVIKTFKTKRDQSKNVQREFDEHLANKKSDDHSNEGTSGNPTRTERSASKDKGDSVRAVTTNVRSLKTTSTDDDNAITAPEGKVDMSTRNVATFKTANSNVVQSNNPQGDRERVCGDGNASRFANSNAAHTIVYQ